MMQNTVDANTTNFITRAEFETRHAELRADVVRFLTDSKSDNASLREDIKNLSNKVDRAAASGWKLLATSTLTFLAGGGLTTAIVYIAHLGVR